MKARVEYGVGRIMTLDWDVHHGNGTQKAFYNSPDVLSYLYYVRLFDEPFPLSNGSREGALFVPEQLALQQSLRK